MTVKFYGLLRRRIGTRAVEVAAGPLPLLELLRRLQEQVGGDFLDELLDPQRELLAGTMILVNGENVRLKRGLATWVRADDVVDLFSPAGGG